MPAKPTVTILLIEDNEDHILLTRKALLDAFPNIAIEVIKDGKEAINYFANLKSQSLPSLILLDLNLPGADGIEVLRSIKKNRLSQAIPVFLLTASNDPEKITLSYQMGIEGHIIKPLHLEGKIKIISDFFKKRRIEWSKKLPSGNNRKAIRCT